MATPVRAAMLGPRNGARAPVGVLIVDPGTFSRTCTIEGLRDAPELEIDACATIDGFQPASAPDIVLFQVSEGGDTASLGHQLRQATTRWPSAARLVVADYPDANDMIAAVRAGAHGLLPATTTVACTRSAMLLLIDGIGVYPTDFVAERCAEPPFVAERSAASPFDLQRAQALTKRQRDVLQLLALGCSNKTIAQQLSISESTVKVHIRAIMAQNGVSNRTQVVAHFLRGSDV